WAQTPLDHFLLAKLEGQGLEPAPSADRRTLLRRASPRLPRLPPAPGGGGAVVTDPPPAAREGGTDPPPPGPPPGRRRGRPRRARERVMEGLGGWPRCGERWGRHWLDVARYADTKGYVFQEERRYPFAYTYRDYVIRAFNDDLPYDRFVVEQIAADRLPPGNDK